jgi:CRP-like cAMP-binding protein
MVTRKIPLTNHIIEALPTRQRDRILNLCTLVELDLGTALCAANQPYQYVYFPLTGFISSIAVSADVPSLELGLIGNEGIVGVDIALGVNSALFQSVVQGSGTALRIPVSDFQREITTNPSLVVLLNRYIYLSIQQLAQAAVCIHFHEIEARLARWLLMTNDCAHSDTFQITHVFLAQMLGVRRSGVTLAAGELRKKSLISYARGKVRILDRKGLEAISCPCYQTMLGNSSGLFLQGSSSAV